MRDEPILYGYWRSSAAYRVRIALHLKELPYRDVPVHLARDGGEQHGAAYRSINPQQLVPALRVGGALLTQSLAIIDYLEELHPAPPLLPADALGRARVRALAQVVACDTHPLGNLRVLQRLTEQFGADEAARLVWSQHWIATGLDALEAMLADDPATGTYCHGDAPGLADACLVPQVYNARRWQLDLARWPSIARIDAACATLDAFRRAHPSMQPDAPAAS